MRWQVVCWLLGLGVGLGIGSHYGMEQGLEQGQDTVVAVDSMTATRQVRLVLQWAQDDLERCEQRADSLELVLLSWEVNPTIRSEP